VGEFATTINATVKYRSALHSRSSYDCADGRFGDSSWAVGIALGFSGTGCDVAEANLSAPIGVCLGVAHYDLKCRSRSESQSKRPEERNVKIFPPSCKRRVQRMVCRCLERRRKITSRRRNNVKPHSSQTARRIVWHSETRKKSQIDPEERKGNRHPFSQTGD